MKTDRLRVRALLERWFTVIVVVLVVGATVGAWLSYGAYAAPGTHQEQRTVDEWVVTGSYAHAATVSDAARGTVFEPGSVVENRTAYFLGVMPVLRGEFHLGYTSADTPVDVTVNNRLVVASVEDRRDGGGVTYWSRTRSLGTHETTVRPGERAVAPFELNVTRTVQTARNTSDRLDSPGELNVTIQSTVTVARGDADSRELLFVLSIQPTSGVYRVTSGTGEERFGETRTVTVPNDPDPLSAVGGPVVLGGCLLAAVGLGVGRSRGKLELTDHEREWLTYRDDRTDFEEWITPIRLPAEADDLPVAHADSLAALVDFAIDTDNAVIEAPDGDAYHVVHDGYRYTYAAPPSPRNNSLDEDETVDDEPSSVES